MNNVVNINNQGTKCAQCGQKVDCPMLDEDHTPSDEAMLANTRILHIGDHVYRAHTPSDSLYRLRTGAVKSSLPTNDGSEQVTGFYRAGEWLGLEALAEAEHSNEAIVLDTSSICAIPIPAILRRMSQSPHAAKVMLKVMGRRLTRKNQLHESLARAKASRRMAAFLVEQATQRRDAGLVDSQIELPMSRGEIASYLALAVETVSRLLTQMQREGVIRVKRHSVEILKPDVLQHIAGQSELSQNEEKMSFATP